MWVCIFCQKLTHFLVFPGFLDCIRQITKKAWLTLLGRTRTASSQSQAFLLRPVRTSLYQEALRFLTISWNI